MRIRFDRRLQCFEPLWGIVEIGDRFVQSLTTETGREFLKISKCHGRLVSLVIVLDLIMASGALDEWIHAPVIAQRIDRIRLAIVG